MRWYRLDIALAADVHPLPPEQPSRVCAYAAEIATLRQELPPYVPYAAMEQKIPWLE